MRYKALKEFAEKEDKIDLFLYGLVHGKDGEESQDIQPRYIVYCGSTEVYKEPKGLEDLEKAAQLTRRN